MSGERNGSLLAAIDRTVTAAGARELAADLAAPLTDAGAIAARHDAVAFFAGDSDCARNLREDLRRAPDIARALARLSVGRGGPRDLGGLRDGLKAARALRDQLAARRSAEATARRSRWPRSDLIEGIAAATASPATSWSICSSPNRRSSRATAASSSPAPCAAG